VARFFCYRYLVLHLGYILFSAFGLDQASVFGFHFSPFTVHVLLTPICVNPCSSAVGLSFGVRKFVGVQTQVK
jgi:hypothetical protein